MCYFSWYKIHLFRYGLVYKDIFLKFFLNLGPPNVLVLFYFVLKVFHSQFYIITNKKTQIIKECVVYQFLKQSL
jgi:hypothetical protein